MGRTALFGPNRRQQATCPGPGRDRLLRLPGGHPDPDRAISTPQFQRDKVTADITITNHSGYLGELFGPAPSADTLFASTPRLTHESITVNDTNGSVWNFNASGSVAYDKTFECNADGGTHFNLAFVIYDDDGTAGPSDSATVTVKCFAPGVTKDALTSFTRTWNWTVDKSADWSTLKLMPGQTFAVNYAVHVTAASVDRAWAVQGKINVYNPAPITVTLNGISDAISGTAAQVNCAVSFPFALGADQTLTCRYSATLPDGADRVNTALATIQNYAYHPDGSATPGGTTDFSGQAAVDFDNAAITQVHECVTIRDDRYGDWGPVCAGETPKTFVYTMTVGPYNMCGTYAFANSAFVVDNTAGGGDHWTIVITVPCEGCTLTPGYWKTHSEFGPAPYDDTWAQSGGENALFFLSGQSWYQVLWTAPEQGNAYYILAHAYIAARLNLLNGAESTPQVEATLGRADEFFSTHAPTTTLSPQARNDALALAYLLDHYNNGYIGPGHCSE